MIRVAHIYWAYGFEFSGEVDAESTHKSSSWEAILSGNRYSRSNLQPLVGHVRELQFENLHFRRKPEPSVSQGQDSEESTHAAVDTYSETIQEIQLRFRVLLFPKWRTGIAILSAEIQKNISPTELIRIERLLGHHGIPSKRSTFSSEDGRAPSNVFTSKLLSVGDALGLKIESNEKDILASMYVFCILETDQLNNRERFGVFTRTRNFVAPADVDVDNFVVQGIELDRGHTLYLSLYSGGVITNRLTESYFHEIEQLFVVMALLKMFTRHVQHQAISISSERKPLEEAENLLDDISSLNLLLTPTTLQGSHTFNSKILPKFLASTSLDQVRDNLENMLRILQNTSDRQQNREINNQLVNLNARTVRLNRLLLVLTIGILLLGGIQVLLNLFNVHI